MVWAWCRDWKVHTALAAVPPRPSVGSGWGVGYGSGSSEASAHPLLLCFPLALSSPLTGENAVSPLPPGGMHRAVLSPQDGTYAPSP